MLGHVHHFAGKGTEVLLPFRGHLAELLEAALQHLAALRRHGLKAAEIGLNGATPLGGEPGEHALALLRIHARQAVKDPELHEFLTLSTTASDFPTLSARPAGPLPSRAAHTRAAAPTLGGPDRLGGGQHHGQHQ